MNAENTATLDDPLVLVHLRNNFYRRKFRFVLGVYALSWVTIFILMGVIIYLAKHSTEPLYFPADKVGRLIPVLPLQEANMSNQAVSDWTVEAIESAYSYNFMNYHGQLQNAQKYFTDYGWRSYMSALRTSNNFLALTERKLIVIAKVVAPPKLINQGLLAGAMAWKFEMPVLMTYLMPPFNEKSKLTNALVVTVVVQRQNELQSYKGLGVVQTIAKLIVAPS
jgi:hypothetical protein